MPEETPTSGPEAPGTRPVLVDYDRELVPLETHLEPRTIREQQVLRVRKFRFSCATTQQPSDAGAAVTSHASLTLVGEPVAPATVEAAVLVFVPDGAELRAPRYDAGSRRILFELPLSRLQAIEDTLRRVDEVYCRYQAQTSGQVWADLHTMLEDVGGGR